MVVTSIKLLVVAAAAAIGVTV